MPNDSDLSCRSELDSPELEPPSVVELELEPDDDGEPESLPEWETSDKFYCLRQCTSKRGWQSAHQSLSQQAGSQTDTHSLGFLSVADAAPSSREAPCCNPSSGRVVMQPTGNPVVGGSNPSPLTMAPPPVAAKMSTPGFKPTLANLASAALPLDHCLC